MKQLTLNPTVLLGLEFFNEKDVAICQEFCRVAVDFLLNDEVNMKLYNVAATKLSVQSSDIKRAVESLMVVINEGAKLNLNETEMKECLSHYKIQEPYISVISEYFLNSIDRIRYKCQQSIPQLVPSYKNLDWRFELNAATRSSRHLCEPNFTLNFTLTDNCSTNQEKNVTFEMDPQTLIHVTQELEKAVAQLKTREYRKIAKFIK